MENKKTWEKIKLYFKTHFNKKRYLVVAGLVLAHGLVAILGISGITSLVKNKQNSEVIVLPTLEPPEEIFTINQGIGSIAEKKQEKYEENKELYEPKENVEVEAGEKETKHETVAVFKREENDGFKPEFAAGAEILNSYTGKKLVKSKTMGDWRIHSGIDIKKDIGESVYAIDKGVVEKIYDDDLFGTTVVISHSGGFSTKYSNLDKNIGIKEGKEIKKGQEIGKIGSSALGEKNEAPHLHFELLKDGEQVNPKDYIKY